MIETALIVPDVHVPYHDKRAWKLLLHVAQELQPQIIITLGDFIDCKSVTGHGLKPKERALLLVDELHAGKRALEALYECAPKARKYFIEGNHENRIARYLEKNAPALEGMFSLREELGINSNYIPYGDYLRIDRMHFTHDLGKAGPTAHRSAREEVGGNVVIGHTHRMGIEYGPKITGTHVSANFGWLGGPEADVDYNKRLRQACSTVLGFGIGFRCTVSKLWWLNAIPIIKNKCIVPTKPLLLG